MSANTKAKASPLAAFISYAKADQSKAQEIADQLEERGFKCWIAPRDVRPGRAYGDEIIRGIERASCLILVLSSASNGSGFVSREIERAVSKNKHIFTVRVEDVEPAPALELFISSTQWIDAFKGRLGPHVDRLAELLAEDDDVSAPESAAPPRSVAPRRTLWRSPLVLGGGAVAVLAALGLLTYFFLRAPAPTAGPAEMSVLAQTCQRLSGEAAIAACDRAIASRRFAGAQLAVLYGARAYEKQLAHDLDGALSDYGDAIRLDPRNDSAFNNRGLIYRDAGEYDRAIADFTQAIAIDPGKPDPYASRGWTYLHTGNQERGRQDIEKALTLSPTPELKAKLEDALAKVRGATSTASAGKQGFFGPDTRKPLTELPAEQREKLAASYGYVGTLVRGDTAMCNATLVGRNLILTSNYCFGGGNASDYKFRILDRDGRELESPIIQSTVSEPLRGVEGSQRVAIARLGTPLGDQVGWVERVGGEPASGDKLDIVALDLRPGVESNLYTVSGAATEDPNCVVLAREADTDIFTHRCITPEGSGGAPIFDAATGNLVGIVGGGVPQYNFAYRTSAVPGLIRQAASN